MRKLLLLALLAFNSYGFSSSKKNMNDHFVSENISSSRINSFLEDSSVIDYDEQKVYLNFERLIFAPNGIFLQNDFGALMPIRHVSYNDGIYCMIREGIWICPECGNVNDNNWRSCHNCGFSLY